MQENLENLIIKPAIQLDASFDTVAMKRLFPEYFDEEKPDYEWDEKDNLIAYIQFHTFPEAIFRRFVKDYYGFAMYTDIVVNYFSRPNPDIAINLLAGYDEDVSDGESEIVDPIYAERKFIWNRGIVIKGTYLNDWSQAEVTKSGNNRVKVRVNGDKKAKMNQLDKILSWFEMEGKDFLPEKIIECQCEKCRKVGSQPYEIGYYHFKNLQDIFVPQIQCYASGELLRLDEISSFEQPEVRLVVIYAETDLPFFKEFYSFFKKQGDFNINL